MKQCTVQRHTFWNLLKYLNYIESIWFRRDFITCYMFVQSISFTNNFLSIQSYVEKLFSNLNRRLGLPKVICNVSRFLIIVSLVHFLHKKWYERYGFSFYFAGGYTKRAARDKEIIIKCISIKIRKSSWIVTTCSNSLIIYF